MATQLFVHFFGAFNQIEFLNVNERTRVCLIIFWALLRFVCACSFTALVHYLLCSEALRAYYASVKGTVKGPSATSCVGDEPTGDTASPVLKRTPKREVRLCCETLVA